MDRPLSQVSYAAYLRDPDLLAVPAPPRPPMPPVLEPDSFGDVPRPAPADSEPLTEVAHPRIVTLAPYWHEGWQHAIPQAYLRAGTAARLYAAVDALPSRFGLAVLDAWRPLTLQQEIYDAAYADPALPPGFVSVPSTDPATPPPHLTGGTVDVALTHDGIALALGTEFDAFTPAAHTTAFEPVPGRVRDLRRLLVTVMTGAGFTAYALEWWHFEHGTRRWAALTGRRPLYGPAAPPARWAVPPRRPRAPSHR